MPRTSGVADAATRSLSIRTPASGYLVVRGNNTSHYEVLPLHSMVQSLPSQGDRPCGGVDPESRPELICWVAPLDCTGPPGSLLRALFQSSKASCFRDRRRS